MPKGIPAAGFRRTKKYKVKSLQELEQDIANKAPYIVEELEKLTKPFSCPHCGNEIRMIDKDVGMYLVDRALGKPKQKHEVDIAENIQLTADQIDVMIQRNPVLARAYEIAQRQLLTEGVIEGEYSEATPGKTETDEN